MVLEIVRQIVPNTYGAKDDGFMDPNQVHSHPDLVWNVKGQLVYRDQVV